jgi:hypothetical protein
VHVHVHLHATSHAMQPHRCGALHSCVRQAMAELTERKALSAPEIRVHPEVVEDTTGAKELVLPEGGRLALNRQGYQVFEMVRGRQHLRGHHGG